LFNGLALALTDVNTPMIFAFCSRFLESFVELVRVYKNFPEVQILVLRLYTDMIKHFEFTVLPVEQISYFHTCTIQLLQAFSTVNLGVNRNVEWDEAEENPYEDVSVVLSMLIALLDVRGVDQMMANVPNAVLPSTVVFTGVNILIPIIKRQMLEVKHTLSIPVEKNMPCWTLPAELFTKHFLSLLYSIDP